MYLVAPDVPRSDRPERCPGYWRFLRTGKDSKSSFSLFLPCCVHLTRDDKDSSMNAL